MATNVKISEIDDNFICPEPDKKLIKSIKERGVLQSIVLKKLPFPIEGVKYEVVAGRRRLLAVMKLGLKTIPAEITKLEGEDCLKASIDENYCRQDNPLDEFAKIKEQIDKGISDIKEISKATFIPLPSVKKRLKLFSLTENFQFCLLSNEITLSVANSLASLPVNQQKKAYAIFMEKGSLTLKDVKGLKTVAKQATIDALDEALFSQESQEKLAVVENQLQSILETLESIEIPSRIQPLYKLLQKMYKEKEDSAEEVVSEINEENVIEFPSQVEAEMVTA